LITFIFVFLLALQIFLKFLLDKSGGNQWGNLYLRVYTNNIRYDNRNNRDPFEELWDVRKTELINSIDFNTAGNANVVCLQEVLHNQLHDILDGLNENVEKRGEWTYYGVGRSDGLTKGEYAPILYRERDWIMLENRTFWLSETPDHPSVGWDAALERIVTMVTLQSRASSETRINFFNTHFDHRGVVARKKSSQLIVDKMKNYNSYPSFLCGDFNTEPTDEPYQILTGAGYRDARVVIPKKYSYGFTSTFSGFNRNEEVNTIIDYIWSPSFTKGIGELRESYSMYGKYLVELHHFGILENFYKGFHFLDHRPVVANYKVRTRPD
jgi:endonuclease/exonuclease/phosphatase family metal-dependent hydrolase